MIYSKNKSYFEIGSDISITLLSLCVCVCVCVCVYIYIYILSFASVEKTNVLMNFGSQDVFFLLLLFGHFFQ